MSEKVELYQRFAACHDATTPAEIGRICGVSRQTASRWKMGENPIPWKYLKMTVVTHGVNWDWLMDGKGSQFRQSAKSKRYRALNRQAVNNRFLSLFPRKSQAGIAEELKVTQTSVHRWQKYKAMVSREALKYAVDTKATTWEWLLEGRK